MKKGITAVLAVAFVLAAAYVVKRPAVPVASVAPAVKAAPIGSDPYFLFIADIHLNAAVDRTPFGCDTGMDLWTGFLNEVTAVCRSKNPPRFVICTGDLPSHCCSTYNICTKKSSCTDQSSDAAHNKSDSIVLTGLRSMVAGTAIPLLYLPGNNDALAGCNTPTDYNAFTNNCGLTPFALSHDKAHPFPALNAPVISGDIGVGYYSASPIAGLRVIALNTVIYTKSFHPSDLQEKYGKQQMAFLESELKDALSKNEKVYLAMHVPPGKDAHGTGDSLMWADSGTRWLNTFLGIVERYDQTIAGVLFGHTHMDELRRLYDSTGTTITEVAISCPGITTGHCNNPGFKTVEYDPTSMELMDFTTHYTTDQNAAVWSDHVYDLNTEFRKDPRITLFDFLTSGGFTPLAIATDMQVIYKVKSGPGHANTIESAIDVRPTK